MKAQEYLPKNVRRVWMGSQTVWPACLCAQKLQLAVSEQIKQRMLSLRV